MGGNDRLNRVKIDTEKVILPAWKAWTSGSAQLIGNKDVAPEAVNRIISAAKSTCSENSKRMPPYVKAHCENPNEKTCRLLGTVGKPYATRNDDEVQ